MLCADCHIKMWNRSAPGARGAWPGRSERGVGGRSVLSHEIQGWARGTNPLFGLLHHEGVLQFGGRIFAIFAVSSLVSCHDTDDRGSGPPALLVDV